MRILVIDDDAQVRAVLVRALESAGHEVQALEDGRRLGEAMASKPDAAFVDVFMPEVDGFQALAQLRAHDPNLPVVVMSGGSAALEGCLAMATRLGAAAVLQKPVDIKVLLETLRSVASPTVMGPTRQR